MLMRELTAALQYNNYCMTPYEWTIKIEKFTHVQDLKTNKKKKQADKQTKNPPNNFN